MSNSSSRSQLSLRSLPDPASTGNILYNPPLPKLRELARPDEITTEYDSASYVSEERSRNADRTKNAIDDQFTAEDWDHIDRAVVALDDGEWVCVDRLLGQHPDYTYRCRLFVPVDHARIALAWAKLFEPVDGPGEPDFATIQQPDTDDIAIRILPEEGFTAVLGSDYTGEAKKSMLRLFMYDVKQRGGLGLHAGSKLVSIETDDGRLEDVGQLFLGLSATGKSTLTAHSYWLDEPEGITVLQDDVCGLLEDGTVVGTEGGGMFVKTYKVNPDVQPTMFEAIRHEFSILENVDVEEDGTVYFHSDRYTSNGRAIIDREELPVADDRIDLDDVDQLFFITRNPMVPPVAKLDPTQATVAFMLGESIETSAGDPDNAGSAVRVVGTNPFIIGDPGEEGNRFRELVIDNDIDCFLLNTGSIGEDGRDITVRDTVTILRELARDTVTWTDDEATGLTIPAHVPGMDIDELDVSDHVENLDERLAALRADRATYLSSFDALEDDVPEAVY